MKSITVFCGSSLGNSEIYSHEATALGTQLAARDITLIYGGAKVGLMGAIADAAISAGGEVIGVLPAFLQTKEIAHDSITELIIVDSMHERKTKMHDLSDGMIAMPGGYGTLEELFEILTWAQLGLHQKPIGILNVAGYYDELIAQIQKMVSSGFLNTLNQEMLLIDKDIDNLLLKMQSYQAPSVPKWIGRQDT